MCLIVVAHRVAENYALILAANRDERHRRPSADAGWWPTAPDVLGGRDLVAGGSWLGINRRGDVAAVTNFAEPGAKPASLSRGTIVSDYLRSADPEQTVARIKLTAEHFGAFNALLLGPGRLDYLSNRVPGRPLAAGIHSLSNAALGADWLKLARAERGMNAVLGDAAPRAALFDLLSERSDSAEPAASYKESLFIVGAEYGTRVSTVLLIGYDGVVRFSERRFAPDGRATGTSDFEFPLQNDASLRAHAL
jgi:uncharacterized protein with NRDE domain